MGAWNYLVYLLFPVPLVCLVLLCLPLPGNIGRFIRKWILKAVDKVLFTGLVSGFNLYQICVILSSLLFLMSCFETAKAATRLEESRGVILDLKEDRLRCQKWRAERNFWISMMSSVLWLVLFRVHKMAKELNFLKSEIADRDKAR